jgi:hypothetical protein
MFPLLWWKRIVCERGLSFAKLAFEISRFGEGGTDTAS